MFYDAEPAADDAEGQALLARFKGRRLPMIDRVEISIIEEEQPRWLAFVNGEVDVAYRVGYQFAPQAMPNGKVAPNLAKRGIRGYPRGRAGAPATTSSTWKTRSSAATAPRKVALRRAIGLGIDSREIIAYAYNGLGTVAQGPIAAAHDRLRPDAQDRVGDYDPARAQALLDLYGYRRPGRRRLARAARRLAAGAARATRSRRRARARSTRCWTKNMTALGIRIELNDRRSGPRT